MASIKNNKILIWLLGAVLAGVWGEIGYQLIWGGSSAGEASADDVAVISAAKIGTKTNYSFGADVRDPFSYYKPEDRSVKKPKAPVHIWAPPTLKLNGVLIGSGKRTAIIESSGRENVFPVERGYTERCENPGY